MAPHAALTPTELIEEIERLRVAAGISQTEFAKRIGLGSQQLWSHYVTGKASHLPLDLVVRALDVFDRRLELYNGHLQRVVGADEDGTSTD